jgi:ferredoxin-NADP reductase/Na+-translocating ferredoxin:NAD+ oxidoreductase RnfD subunit
MNFIDGFLNRITMYRLTLWVLGLLAALSIVFAFFGYLPFTALQMTVSIVVLLVVARLANGVFALFFKAAPSSESAYITALILFFVLTPVQSSHETLLLAVAAAVAMLSKYLIAPWKKHIFNPAAFAALVMSLAGTGLALWWVATPIMVLFIAAGGLLLVRKLRRFDLLLAFVITATVAFGVRAFITHGQLLPLLTQLVMSWPLVFLGTVMLTEPQTTPPHRTDRLIYGVIVGLLFSLSFKIGPLVSSPELALLIGNMYSFAVSFRKRVTLTLKEKLPLTRDIYEFVFVPKQSFRFMPGQYMEWTLPHKSPDKRGNRRFFTIASAPEDPYIRLGMRVPIEGSSFKKTLGALQKGTILTAANIGGEFVLPLDPDQKIGAIAGGIGITPFMSMFRHLAERDEHRDIVLIYSAGSPLDFAYQPELDGFKEKIGLKILYLPTDFAEISNWVGKSGYVTSDIVRKEAPDFKKRTWYFSGPQAMVTNYTKLIEGMGVHSSAIKKDYFPGL